jgi:predicted transcriptional regulator
MHFLGGIDRQREEIIGMKSRKNANTIVATAIFQTLQREVLKERVFQTMIDNGLRDVAAGRHYSSESVRKAIESWRR